MQGDFVVLQSSPVIIASATALTTALAEGGAASDSAANASLVSRPEPTWTGLDLVMVHLVNWRALIIRKVRKLLDQVHQDPLVILSLMDQAISQKLR